MVRNSLQAIALFAALVAGGCGGCSCRDEGVADRPPTGSSPEVSLFSDAFSFACSADRSVGCDGVFPVRRGAGDHPSALAILQTGEDALRARVRLLEQATRSIRVQALIFRGDEAGLKVSEVLKRKAAEGVDVRVIVDALSNLDGDTQWMYFDLKQHGVEVEGYETLYLNWIAADLRADDPLRPNKRFHDKLWIVDAESLDSARAIVGGLNIANEYFRVADEPLGRWRDQDVMLKGAVVKDVTRGFDRNYDYLKSLKERLPAIFNPDNSWKLTRAVLDRVKRVDVPVRVRPKLARLVDEILEGEEPRLSWQPVTVRFLQSRPRFEEEYIAQTYLHLIRRAKERIDITNAYFVPSRTVLDALKAAARRGVKVRILTNSPATNDIGPVAVISRHLYRELLAVNREEGRADQDPVLEVYEWVGPEKGEGTLHAKLALFDDEVAVVGSYNLDPRSERLNSETAVAVKSRPVVDALRRRFEEQDLRKSDPVTFAEAERYHDPEGLHAKFDLLFALPLKSWL